MTEKKPNVGRDSHPAISPKTHRHPSSRGLRQAGEQANASLPFVPARQSSALALERQLLKEAAAILKILLELNARQQWLSKE